MWTIFLSLKYFFSKRKEGMISLIGVISVLGVALGVASLVVVLSVMNGFDDEIREKIIGTYAHIVVMREGGIAGSASMVSKIEEMPGVESAAPFITGQGILRRNDSATGILLKGIEPEREAEVSDIMEYTAEAGRDLGENTIIIGAELMKKNNISVGEHVEILIPYSEKDIETTSLEVIGSFSSGRYDYDANMAIVGIDTARKLFRIQDAVTGIGIRVNDALAVENIKHDLQTKLGYPFVVKSWMDLDRNLVSALALEKKMMFILLALIIIVACFNIAGSLMMMVMEKTKDIGILRAIGSSGTSVSFIFLMEGAMIGFLGTALGTGLGIFLAKNVNEAAALIEKVTGARVFPSDVYYFTEIPSKVSSTDVSAIIIVAMALAIGSAVYPAWKALRLDPVEAIRYE